MNEPTPAVHPNTIRRLAYVDPDYAAFADRNKDLAGASIPADIEAELTAELANLLQQLPDTSQALTRIGSGGKEATFGLVSIPILLASAFLLRTHFRIKRHTNGKWELEVEHKPGDGKLVSGIVAKINQLLSR